MHYLSILFFALSSSSDNLIVGLSYGIKKVKINSINNLLVALISGAGTFIAMLLGNFIRSYAHLPSNLIGSILLISFGFYTMSKPYIDEYRNRKKTGLNKVTHSSVETYENIIKHPDLLDTNRSNTIDLNEAITLGFILSLNNVGLGIAASIAGLNVYLTTLFSIFFSILFIPLGYYIGRHLISDKFSPYAELISGAIIMLLGIYELFI
jgi:putative sporulation protein YtaF